MKFMLFTTSDVLSKDRTALAKMISSLEAAQVAYPDLNINVHLLLQRSSGTPPKFPPWIKISTIENRIPLSVARNRLLAEAFSAGEVGENDIYAFPDDDSWYPSTFLELVSNLFQRDPQLDFWFCRYSSNPETPSSIKFEVPSLQNVISRASSNTIFFRGRMLELVGKFDETLGVGTLLNGGEDTDYALAAFYIARKVLFSNVALVGHRDTNPALIPTYFPGSMKALKRHRKKSIAGTIAYCRKAMIGLILVVRGRLGVRTLFTALFSPPSPDRTN